MRPALAPFLLLAALATAQAPAPEVAVRTEVSESLDLLCVAARFAGFEEYQPRTPESGYSKAIAANFEGQSEHDLVQRLRVLRSEKGIGYDAVAGLAVHVGPLPGLEERCALDPRPPMLDARWDGADVKGLVALLRDFATRGDAAKFFDGWREHHREAERRLAAQLARSKALPWFDAFFGKRAGASCIAQVGLLCGGHNYGVSIRFADGRPDELRPVFGCWKFDEQGLPVFGDEMLSLFVHELCHAYTNPIVERHAKVLQDAGNRLFAAKAAAMRRQAYGNAHTVLCETFVRACVIRCMYDTEGEAAGRRQERFEVQKHFPWTVELAALLREYQADRTKYSDFDAFVPRMAEALDRIAAALADAPQPPEVVRTDPADGSADVDPARTSITIEFDRPMRDQSWSVVGTKAELPAITGKPFYDRVRRVLTLPVQLEPGRTYRIRLNDEVRTGFQAENGAVLLPVVVEFRTRAK